MAVGIDVPEYFDSSVTKVKVAEGAHAIKKDRLEQD